MATPSAPDPALLATYLAELDRHHRRNSWLFYADGFTFLFGLAAMFPSTILAGYIGHFDDSASAPATLTLLFLAGMALLQPLGAFLSHRRERRKSLVVFFAVLQKLPILGLWLFSLVAERHPELVLPVVYVLFGIFSLFCGLVSPIWADWIGRVLDPRRRGHTLGLRTFWMSLGGLLGSLVAGVLLEGEGAGAHTYSLLLLLALVATTASIPCLLGMVETDFPVKTQVRPLASFMKRLVTVLRENPAFRRYMLAMTLFFGTSIVPSVALWVAEQRFGRLESGWNSDRAAGRWNVILWLVQALFGLAIARLAQRLGPRPALWAEGLAAASLPVLALLAPGPLSYSLVFVAFGVFQAAFFIAHLGSIYALAPGEDRLPYLAVAELLKIPMLIASILGGAWLIDRGDLASLHWVLGASALAPLLGLWLMPRIAPE